MFFKLRGTNSNQENEYTRFIKYLVSCYQIIQSNILINMDNKNYIETRIKYYLGDIYDKSDVKPCNEYINVDILLNNMDETRQKYPKGIFEHGIYSNMICKLTLSGLKALNIYISGYTKHVIPYLEAFSLQNKYLLYLIGDVEKMIDDYYFTKIRIEGCKNPIIIKAANISRHWGVIHSREVFNNDIPFFRKKGVALWRGATTGQPNRIANRFDLVTSYFRSTNPKINIGFSNIAWGTVDTSGNIIDYNNYRPYVKGKMTIKQQLEYKYLISVDGNDKSSSINWQLASNSLVFMVKPTKISWLMEDRLIPNVHYIQLKDDFSDLEEKLDWCEQNPIKCQEIVNNSTQYMSHFYQDEREKYIEAQVIMIYLRKMNFSKISFTD